jgi:hypothetical protein
MGCFSFWTVTLAWSMRSYLQVSRRTTVIASALIGIGAAGVGELAQFGMSNHTPEWRGFGWSVAGVAVAVALILAAFWVQRASQAR